jgi:multiple sugar transport system permease protein
MTRTVRAPLRLTLAYAALLVGSAAMLVPFLWMVATSFKADSEIFAYPPIWIPETILWQNYPKVLELLPFQRYLINTTFVSTTVTALEVVTSSLAAYAFARLPFPGRDRLFLIYLATLMVPGQVTIIPNFLLMSWFGWTNSYLALIIPAAFTAFGTFLLRQFFLTIPRELEEAAKIDGCGHIRILRSVIIPIAAPALAVLAVFTFLSYWNSFLWPLIIINDTNKMTVPLGLELFLGQQGQRWELLMAAATISMVPTVILVLALQKYLVRGIALSGLGGR